VTPREAAEQAQTKPSYSYLKPTQRCTKPTYDGAVRLLKLDYILWGQPVGHALERRRWKAC